MISDPYLKYIKDIRFWILLFFAFRLYGITNPPLEPGSVWRQCDGLMIARNFYEHNPNILYPTVDLPGDKTGIVGSEFPLFNYLIYIFSIVFGYHDWFGRVINLIVSSLGIFYFYKLILKYFNEKSAFNSTLILLGSLWFTYSRVAVPDTFATSLCIVGIYFAMKFLEEGRKTFLVSFFLLASLGCLSKISAASVLTVLAIPLLSSELLIRRKVAFVIASTLIMCIVFSWYFYWVPFLNNTYGYGGHFFMGRKFSEGLSQILNDWPRALERFYNTPLKYSGFLGFFIGLIAIIRNKKWTLLTIFLLPFICFLIVIIDSGEYFIINGHYSLIIIPAMAFVAGSGLSLLKQNNIVKIFLLIIVLEGVGNQFHTLKIRYPLKTLEILESTLDKAKIKPDDLIAINSVHEDPTALYFAHRKGWNVPNSELLQPNQIDYLKANNCKYIVIIKHMPSLEANDIELPFIKILDSKDFAVYQLM